MNSLQLIRHSTVTVTFGEVTFLVDPMLSSKSEMDPIQNAGNDIRIPMIGLGLSEEELKKLLEKTDAVLLTHLHRDHFDAKAQEMIDKGKTIFCQPPDEQVLIEEGFSDVRPVQRDVSWRGIQLFRTGGRHGTAEIGKKMGPVSGFILKDENLSCYIAGNTIWCEEVNDALQKYRPEYTILNGGGAEFLTGGPITMTVPDIISVCLAAPWTQVICVHMDAINHCRYGKKDLRNFVNKSVFKNRIEIPEEGEICILQKKN